MPDRVFLTGGSGGLGIPVVRKLLDEKWEITALVSSDKSAQKLRDSFSEAVDTQLQIIKGNVTEEADIKSALQKAGNINALVHLAGGFKGAGGFEENSLEDFEKMFSLNTLSTFLLLKNILRLMKNRKSGSIVMIGAKPALYPNGQNAVYAASKAALINLILTAAEEGRPYNVRANVIVPAVIDTPGNRQWADENTATDKWTPPEDIAQTIAWLISEKGKAMTGMVIPMYNKMKTF